MTGVLCNKRMPPGLKSLVYKTVVCSVALYGAKCWSTTKTTEHLLRVMEMRMLRWTLGFTSFDQIRNTKQIQEMGVTPITERMREYRLRGHGQAHQRINSCKHCLHQGCQTRRLLGSHCMLAIVPRAARCFRFGDHHFTEQRSLLCSAQRGRSPKKKKVITSPAFPHHRPSSGIANQK